MDLNLGCPQKVAERGQYGAFMMDRNHWPNIRKIVSTMSKGLTVPVTVKVRVFEDVNKTLAYCEMLQESGASLLAIHPRTRGQREEVMADWAQIRRVKQRLRIPVIANGDCWHAEDVWLCMCQTGADGVMSAQGLLHNPALFEPLANARKSLTETFECDCTHIRDRTSQTSSQKKSVECIRDGESGDFVQVWKGK